MRRTCYEACHHATKHGINIETDFHALTSDEAERVLSAADEWRYRAPKNANGSRARYFHAFLRRLAERDA